MPELPEVEALAADLRERVVGHAIDRLEVAAISALKTFDPPPAALHGRQITGAGRFGKFLDLVAGDLHLVTLTEACTGLAVPSKSYGIFAAGRPILYQGSPDGEIARVILEEGVGTVVPLGAVEALQQCILTYMSQPTLSQRQGQKARALVEGRYSRVSALERYTKVLTQPSTAPSLM